MNGRRALSIVMVSTVGVFIAPAAARSQGPAAAPGSAPAPCVTVSAKLLGTIDTKIVKAGAPFRFATTSAVTYVGRAIPAGTLGAGTVMTMDHSKSHGESGYLVLEARYLELADGSKLPVAMMPGSDGHSDTYVRAGSSDAPSVFGYVPYISTGASVYDYFHHGKDAAFVSGSVFPIVVGDDFVSGACALTPRD